MNPWSRLIIILAGWVALLAGSLWLLRDALAAAALLTVGLITVSAGGAGVAAPLLRRRRRRLRGRDRVPALWVVVLALGLLMTAAGFVELVQWAADR